MSKAFTRETDDDQRMSWSRKNSLPQGRKTHHARRLHNLQAQLKDLFNVQRRKPSVVSRAAALGDRSGDYLYGKQRLRKIDKRIRFLTKRIGYAEIVDPPNSPRTRFSVPPSWSG